METEVRLIAGVILLASNAFFVASEFALTRLRQYGRAQLEDHRGLNKAWEMTETLEIYLTGCQVGITFSSILLGIVAEPAVTELLGTLLAGIGSGTGHAVSITISVVLINMAHTVWGEQVPTYLGIERARGVAKACAYPLYWWTTLTYPFIYLGDKVSKATLAIFGIKISRSWLKKDDGSVTSMAEVKAGMASLLKSGGLPSDRREEVMQALEIDNIPVRDIMIGREQIVSLSTQKTIRENMDVIREHMHARYPLVGESLDDFKGILYTPEILAHITELLDESRELDDFDWPRMIIEPDLPVSALIDAFQQSNQELALISEKDRVIGLVTLTDALETIVGNVEDPLDLA